ncbi:hypothetical protein CVT24_010695 [Panaeolus cyanescens]|uniref:Uncharacterized protein n=1 Tax=Panaeolus cyanescens TaxID=181874 RepID=A0A409YM98_9AGAR|nr:hypothetical protein CVT24_010695 [Panaeolus cyanescens]
MYPLSTSTGRAATHRAMKADPNKGRCTIENCAEGGAIVPVYVFEHFKGDEDGELFDALEYTGGSGRGELTLDTRRNIFFLGESLCTLYRAKKWALLPSAQDVYDHRKAGSRSNIDRKTYTYTFLPLHDMEDIFITRQSNQDRTNVAVYDFPYAEFPSIESHVHPRFAILQFGFAFANPLLSKATKAALLNRYPHISTVISLHQKWLSRTEFPLWNKNGVHQTGSKGAAECEDGTPRRRNGPLLASLRYNLPDRLDTDEDEGDWEIRPPQVVSRTERGGMMSVDGVRDHVYEDLADAGDAGKEITSVERFRLAGDETLGSMRWTHERVLKWAAHLY